MGRVVLMGAKEALSELWQARLLLWSSPSSAHPPALQGSAWTPQRSTEVGSQLVSGVRDWARAQCPASTAR